jgi:hypothetical protein
MKKRSSKKVFFFIIVPIVLVIAGFLLFRFLGISERLKCRVEKINIIKVNRNVEPKPGVLPPVWKGIIPGKTTIQEVENILKDQITRRQTAAGVTMLYLEKEKHGFFVPSVLIDRDGTVEEIFTTEPSRGYSKNQLVIKYGEPEGEVSIYESPDVHIIDNDILIYSSKGLIASVDHSLDSGASVDHSSDDVEYFNYFEPMSIEKFKKTLGKQYERSISSCD